LVVRTQAIMRKMQLTLAILKPDVTALPFHVLHARERILRAGFLVLASAEVRLSRRRAEAFYEEHRHKFFFNRLVSFISSGPVHVHALAAENAIANWRELMGPTKVFKTRFERPDTLRGQLGLSDTRNTCHGSDSDESARREIAFFFPDFDVNSEMMRAAEVPEVLAPRWPA